MFTGLIEAVGEVGEVARDGEAARIEVRTALAAELKPGDSLAVNGVCLTVVTTDATGVRVDIGPATTKVTTLGNLAPGQAVNLERPLRADGRFGGHFVQGHVDGTGRVEAIRPDGDAHWLTVGFDRALAPYLIPKGSIAVDGVSLTIAALDERTFTVMLIPFTWVHTCLNRLRPGDPVNLECDMVGKYVANAVRTLT
jgi:riboflavin synthase